MALSAEFLSPLAMLKRISGKKKAVALTWVQKCLTKEKKNLNLSWTD
jgi:hypothetical protein